MDTLSKSTSEAVEPGKTAQKKRVRLEYLDGLRGLAALYVVLNHSSILSMILLGDKSGGHSHIGKILHLVHYCIFNYGVDAVSFFIVLSGYCLMLPVVQSSDETMRGGTWEFIKRRARRICPPYYAALAICVLLAAIGPMVHIDVNAMNWYYLADPVFTPGALISHLTLMHCWTPWITKIDPPMWSVSVEWNIYFAFALVLLPLFKKFGNAVVLTFAFIISLAPHFIFHGFLDKAHPWMLGLFALGMFAAAVNFSPRPEAKKLLDKVHWGWMSAVAAFGLVVLTYAHDRASLKTTGLLSHVRSEFLMGPLLEILAGLLAMCVIIWCTRESDKTSTLPPFFRILESTAALRLGAFSYSLYLIHDPVIELFWLWGKESHMKPLVGALMIYFLAVPVAVGFAYLFHLAFERPFLPRHYRKVLETLP